MASTPRVEESDGLKKEVMRSEKMKMRESDSMIDYGI